MQKLSDIPMPSTQYCADLFANAVAEVEKQLLKVK